MSSVSAAALHSQQHPHYKSVAITTLSHTSSQMSNSEKIKVTNPKLQLQQRIPFSRLQVNDGDQEEVNKAHGPETETGGEGTEGTASGKEAKEEFASKSHPSTAVSSALSLASGTDSPPSFTTILTAMITAVTTTAVSEQTQTRSAQTEMKTQRPDVILPSNTTTEPRSHLTEYHNHPLHGTSGPPLWSPSLSPPPVCPYPPVPAHGTLFFHNVENPGPRESRHYIQYACYPGYTLAHGDIHSFCQQGGTWSGITPVCLGR